MTVREMMAKLSAMIAVDPSVADMEVDSDGCDCIDSAEDVRIQIGTRRILVDRDEDKPAHVDLLSAPALAMLQRMTDPAVMVPVPENSTQPYDVQELRTRGFVYYKWTYKNGHTCGTSNGRYVVISDAGRSYLKEHT